LPGGGALQKEIGDVLKRNTLLSIGGRDMEMMRYSQINLANSTVLVIALAIFILMPVGWLLNIHLGHEIIRAMYEGRSICFLNRIIEGQAVHPVEHYFATWDSLFLTLNIAFFTGLMYVFLIAANVRINLVISILSIAGILLALISTSKYGAGMTLDSAMYISAAQKLLSGNGYLIYSGSPLIMFPPLFSTILAIIGLAGVNLLSGARFLNAVLFGLIIFISGQLFRTSLCSKKLIILGVASILLSVPLLGVSTMVCSEPLFILLVILFIICLLKFLSEKRWHILVLLSIIAALSCIQRYIGVTLVFTGVVSIIFLLPKTSFSRKLRYGIVFCAVSITPLFIWIVRNYILAGTFFGSRLSSDYSLSHNIYRTLDVVTTWFLPQETPFYMRMIGACLMALLIIGATLYFRSKRNGYTGIFILIYSFFLISTATKVAFNMIDDRLLSPIYVFIVFLILIGAEDISNSLNRLSKKRLATNIIITLCAIWLAYPSFRVFRQISLRMVYGAGGYNTVTWQESPLIERLKVQPLAGAIYSNAPDAVYLFTGKKAKMIPSSTRRNGLPKNDEEGLWRFKESLKLNNRSYLIWFFNTKRAYLCDIDDLRSIFTLERIASFSDGTIYLFKQKGPL
jgi:hypothetical protein